MKQNIDAEQWGPYERSNPEAAKHFREWLDERDYPQDPSGCTLYDIEPVWVRANIGRMIEFLQPYLSDIQTHRFGFGDNSIGDNGWTVYLLPPNNKSFRSEILCDVLWEAVKEVSEV